MTKPKYVNPSWLNESEMKTFFTENRMTFREAFKYLLSRKGEYCGSLAEIAVCDIFAKILPQKLLTKWEDECAVCSTRYWKTLDRKYANLYLKNYKIGGRIAAPKKS